MLRCETVKKIDTKSWFRRAIYACDLDKEREMPQVLFAKQRSDRRVSGGLSEVLENSYIFSVL
jgi:hypothetical protein